MQVAPSLAEATGGWLPAAVGGAVAAAWIAWVLRRAPEPEAAEGAARTPPRRPRLRLAFIAGLGAAGATWFLTDSLVLGAAVLLAWQSGSRLLEARRTEREFASEEAHALAAIGTATRALRAGIPLAGVVGILSTEARGEAGAAFREIVQREGMGEELPSAIRRTLLGSRLAALRAFGLALLMQVKAGGNIADTSDRLARSLVERNRVRRRARTIVAYGRAAAIVLGLLPAAIIPLLSLNVDGYADFLLDRPVGNMLLAASALLIATGLLMVQRMCRIDRVGAWGTR
jgi:tight adherence protein B